MANDMHARKRQVGAWIRIRREELGLTKAELARRAEVSYITVLNAESGRNELRMHRAIEDALQWHPGTIKRAYEQGIPPQDMNGKGSPPPLRLPPTPQNDEELLASITNSDGSINGLALLIHGRIAELAQQRNEPRMSLAELARRSGLHAATVHQYASGTIRGKNLTGSVRDKLEKLAAALELPSSILLATARDSKYDKEEELLKSWRELTTTESRDRALAVIKALVSEENKASKLDAPPKSALS